MLINWIFNLYLFGVKFINNGNQNINLNIIKNITPIDNT